jgi:hypothetical protein
MKIAIAVASSLLLATSALAEPTVMSDSEMDNVVAGQGVIGDLFSSASPGDVGPSISGDIYGNTSNPTSSGHGVVPSLSPGPWVCGNPSDCAGPTEAGGSMGDFLAPVASGGQAAPDFANGRSPGPDFSQPPKP